MENLSLQDRSSSSQNAPDGGSAPAAAAAPQGPPQLPPQMFTTAAQLLDLTDKKLLLVLRDGRKLLGVLRSWDQFANLVLTGTVERYHVITSTRPQGDDSVAANASSDTEERGLYADVPRGTYLVRGENVLLLGEVDLDKDDDPPPGYTEGEVGEVFALWKEEEARRKAGEKDRRKMAEVGWGGEVESSGEVLF